MSFNKLFLFLNVCFPLRKIVILIITIPAPIELLKELNEVIHRTVHFLKHNISSVSAIMMMIINFSQRAFTSNSKTIICMYQMLTIHQTLFQVSCKIIKFHFFNSFNLLIQCLIRAGYVLSAI